MPRGLLRTDSRGTEVKSARTVVYRGYVTLNGRTTLELEVYRDPRHPRKWLFYRTSNGSRERFKYADDAMAHGTRLSPKMEWRKEYMEADK